MEVEIGKSTEIVRNGKMGSVSYFSGSLRCEFKILSNLHVSLMQGDYKNGKFGKLEI